MNEPNVIIVGGFGLSGSSALNELLKEFNGIYDIGDEARFIVDPDGILSLEDALLSSWTPYQSDLALKRFLILIRKLSNKYSYPYFFSNHKKLMGPKFMQLSEEYIEQLISFSYKGKWAGINNPLIFFSDIVNKRIKKKFNTSLIHAFYKDVNVSYKPDEFVDITKKYLRSVMQLFIDNHNASTVVFDEGYASMNPSKVLKYFESARMVTTFRDPRDMYVEALNRYFFVPQTAEKFISWFECTHRQNKKENEYQDVLNIRFEDLIINYEDVIIQIMDFLSLDKSSHCNQFKHLKPEVSIKNIGLWKNHKSQKDIELIYSKLKSYCYE